MGPEAENAIDESRPGAFGQVGGDHAQGAEVVSIHPSPTIAILVVMSIMSCWRVPHGDPLSGRLRRASLAGLGP
jgi:hypothetical protein